MSEDTARPDGREDESRGMPLWKKLLLGLAGVFVIAGLFLRFGTEPAAAPASGGPDMGASFLPGSEDAQVDAPRGGSDWSPFFLQGGFGFFLGFSIGTVLRTFFKVFAFGAGLLFLALFGLQYLGVEVPWDRMQEFYDSIAGRLAEQADGFLAFLQGAVPATALSGAGLVAGLKKN